MRRLKIAVSLALAALAVFYGFGQWSAFPMDTQPMIEKKYGGWSGVLRLWVCEDWQVGSGNVSAWLNRCIQSYEKAHPGVYVQSEYVQSLDDDGLVPPDMMLFSAGALESEGALLPLADIPLRAGIARPECALPVMIGGYMWTYNAALLESIPRDWQNVEVTMAMLPDDAQHMWSAALLGLCSGTYSEETITSETEISGSIDLGLSMGTTTPTPAPTAETGTLRCVLPAGFAADAGAWQDFLNGDAAAMPVTQREIRRLQALSDQGKGPDWRLVGTGSAFTDQVMYIAVVDKPGSADNRGLCREFAAHVLSDACQSQLYRIGAFAVTDATSGYAAGDPLEDMDAFLRKGGLCAPAPFDSGWRADVEPVLRKFLAGDEDPAALWRALSERLR